MMYGLLVRVTVSALDEAGGASADELLNHVDQVTEELVELEACTPGLLDSSIGFDAQTGTAEVEITVEAGPAEEAFSIGISCLRTAIHTAGGGTPDWDETTVPGEHAVLFRLDDSELRPLVPA